MEYSIHYLCGIWKLAFRIKKRSRRGGTGRHAGLKNPWSNPCRFESDRRHMNKNALSYIIGVAIGDGNLSNPNGRAVRLRITCDTTYPGIIKRIQNSVQRVMPKNKVSLIRNKRNCIDISCYSNEWEQLLGWKAKSGPKHFQKISIPEWVLNNKKYTLNCLRGLFETDGSVYVDRGYRMINFVTVMHPLAKQIQKIIQEMGFRANLYTYIHTGKQNKYTLRISKNSQDFLSLLKLEKN